MKYLYLLLFSIVPAIVFSQTNFQKGYIIKAGADTLRGYVDYHEWNRNPQTINFKLAKEDKEAISYKPENISEFSISGYDTYRSYRCIISTGKITGTDLSIGLDTGTVTAQVFLKVLADGPSVKLYNYTDDIKSRFFIQENESAPVELAYAIFYNSDQETQLVTREQYKRQLSFLAQKYATDNTKVASEITKLLYSERDILKVINLINNKTQVKGAKEKYYRFFAGGGLNFSQTKFSGASVFTGAGGGKSTTPEISAGMDFFSNPHIQRLIFRGEFLFSWVNPTIRAKDDFGAGYVASINQHTFTFLPQVIYNFYNTQNVKVFFSGGLGFNWSAYSDSKYQIINNGQVVGGQPYKLEAYWVKFPVEFGLGLNKRIEIIARYTFPTAFSSYTAYNIANTEYHVGAHFLF